MPGSGCNGQYFAVAAVVTVLVVVVVVRSRRARDTFGASWPRSSSESGTLTEIVAPLKRIIAGRGNCGTLLGTGLSRLPQIRPPANFEPLQSTRFSRRASLDKMSLPPLSRLRTTASIFSLTADNRNDDITCPIPRVSPVSPRLVARLSLVLVQIFAPPCDPRLEKSSYMSSSFFSLATCVLVRGVNREETDCVRSYFSVARQCAMQTANKNHDRSDRR